MSITFAVESIATGAFEVRCWDAMAQGADEPSLVATEGSYEVAVATATTHTAACVECGMGGFASVRAVVDVDVNVNMHNGGAYRVLVAMGLDAAEVMSGGATIDAQDVLARLALADAAVAAGHLVEAQESPVAQALGAGGAQIIACEDVRDLDGRLGRVAEVVREAARLGRAVTIC